MRQSLWSLALLASLAAACTQDDPAASSIRNGDASPLISSVEPAQGPVAGGTVVLLRGERFAPGATVAFGGFPSTAVVVADAKTLTALTPEGLEGPADVVVMNPDNTSSTLAGGFTFTTGDGVAPTLTAALPAQGPTTGGSLIELHGTGFTDGALAFIGGRPATSVVVNSADMLTLVTPPGTTGPAEIAVTNLDGRSARLPDAFGYYDPASAQRPAPRLLAIEPAQGAVTGGDELFLAGSGFVPGVRAYVGGRPATGIVLEAARLRALSPANNAGLADVYVTNPDGQSHALLKAFNYFRPASLLARIEPFSGPIGGGTAVTVYGKNFAAGTVVNVGKAQLAEQVVVDGQTIKGKTQANDTAGWSDVEVVSGGGRDVLKNAFFFTDATHPAPGTANMRVLRAIPTSHSDAGGSTVTLYGEGFQTGVKVAVNGAPGTNVKVLGASSLSFTMPAGKPGPATIDVENPDKGKDSLSGTVYYYSAASTAPAPKVSAIAPTVGPDSGGTRATVLGANFATGVRVLFGARESTHVARLSATQLVVDTPAAVAAGPVNVTVANPDGKSDSLLSGFAYYPRAPGQLDPTVASLTPNIGASEGTTAVTITGTTFQPGALVYAGDVPATQVTVVSATEITATIAGAAPGSVDVVVVNPDGTTGKLGGGFTFKQAAPSLTSVRPVSGPVAGGLSALLVGANFSRGATVNFGSNASADVKWIDSTVLKALIPAGTVGKVDVEVTNADGQKTSLKQAFEYDPSWVAGPKPELTAVLPAKGPATGGSLVLLRGTNFVKGALILFGDAQATEITLVDANSASAVTPAGAVGAVHVTLVNPDGQTTVLQGGFSYLDPATLGPAPELTTLTPAVGRESLATQVVLGGKNFKSGSYAFFGGALAANPVLVSASAYQVEALPHAAGVVDAAITGPDGQTAWLRGGFTYAARPAVASLTPNGGPTAGGTRISITGASLQAGATVEIGGKAATNVIVRSATSLDCTTAANVAGQVDVKVTNPDGQSGTLANGFAYVGPPSIDQNGVTPASGPSTGGTIAVVKGSGFVSGSTVTVGGKPATIEIIDPNTLVIELPAGTTGTADVVFKTPDGQTATLPGGFTYKDPSSLGAPPVVTRATPATGPIGGGTALSISGSQFARGALTFFGMRPATRSLFIDAQVLTATTPAVTAAGKVFLAVTNPDGQTAKVTDGFEYLDASKLGPAPTLSAVFPDKASIFGGTSVSATGSGFTGATFFFNGRPPDAATIASATSATLTAPASDPGPGELAVTSADGQTVVYQGSFEYVVPPPEPLVVSPNTGSTRGGTKLTVGGRQFQTGAQVTVGGAPCANANVLTDKAIECTTPAGVDGPAAIRVINADGKSAALSGAFTYVSPPLPASVSPSTGPDSGGTLITVKGTFFRTGVTAAVGGKPCTGLTLVSDTELSCTTPAGTPGAAVIALTNTDGQVGTLSGAFAYEPPLGIGRIAPPTGPDKGGIAVTLSGANFKTGATVKVGANAATNVTVIDSSTITFTLPAGAMGLATVTVANPDGGKVTLTGGFSYFDSTTSGPFPTLSRVAPSLGPVAGGTRVQLTGASFLKGAKVYFGGVEMAAPKLLAAGLIVGDTPAGAGVGSVPVMVMNADGRSDTAFSGFTYYTPSATQKAPAPALLSPDFGSSRGDTVVTLTGADFANGALVFAGDWPASAVAVASATSLTATFGPQAAGLVDVTVVNPDGLSGRLNGAFEFRTPAPKLTALRPARGPLAGGITALLLGTDFDRGATVTFGRSVSTDVKYVDATALTAVVPSGVAGKVDVMITNPDGKSSTLTAAFEYDPNWVAGPKPVVTSVQPPRGPTTGGSAVLVRGDGFVKGAVVLFADAQATDVNLVDLKTLYAVTPAASAGPAHVTVLNPDGQLGVLPGGFTYVDPASLGAKPTLSGTSPTSGPETAATSALLTGTGFRTGGYVFFGGFPAANPLVLSSTIYQAEAQPHAPGPVDVAFTNADGTSAILRGGFTYVARPSLVSSTPSSGPTAGGTRLLVTGEAFQGGATVAIGGTLASGVNVRSATLLECTSPAGVAGAADIVVTNPDKQTATLAKAFTFVPPPSFDATSPVTPPTGPATGGTIAIVKGADFAAGATVTIGGKPAVVELVNANTLVVELPAGTVGYVDVTVKNADGQQATATRAFVYRDPASLGPKPTLTAISPAKGPQTGGTTAALAGGNFGAGALVFFALRPASNATYVAVDSLTATSPAGANVGKVPVAVTNPDGQTVKVADLFEYVDPATLGPAPAIGALAPQQASVFGGSSIAAGGANFVQGAVFFFAGKPSASTTVNSPTSATVIAPTGTAGPASVVVTNPDGQTAVYKGSFDYIVPPPEPQVVSPNRGSTRGGTTVTISGKSFQAGATVQISGAPCASPTTVNSNTLTCVTPAGVDGPANVKVVNPDGQSATLASGFTYAAPPDPQKVSPTSGPEAGGTSINITGAFFAPGLTVTIASKPCNNTNRVSASLITCDVPAGTAGPAAVTVTNPDGQFTTLPAGFTYLPPIAPPTISSVSPNYGSIRGGSGVTIVGTSFQVGAKVYFGTIASGQVTVTSNTSLACSTPAQAAGTVSVTVENPDGQRATLASAYEYLPDAALPPLAVSQISPNTGATAGGTLLTITGNGFQAGLAVTIGGQLCLNITRLGPTGLTCETPSGSAGPVAVAITNPDGQQVIVPNGFTYDIGGRYVLAGHNLPMEATGNKRGAILVDVDQDNDLDFFMTTMNGGYTQPWLELNDGKGVFTLAMQNLPPLCGTGNCEPNNSYAVQYKQPIAVDIDKDLDKDLVVLNEHQVVVYVNDGGGSYARSAFNICPNSSNGVQAADARDLTLGDFDNDGDLDVAVARWSTGRSCWDGAANVGVNGEVLMENLTMGTSTSGAWDFEDATTGNTALDSSGKANNLTLSAAGLISTSGHVGQALSLNGTNQYATAPSSATLNPTEGITLSAWVYQTGNLTGTNTIVAKENQYTMAVSNGQLKLAVQTWGGPTWTYVGSGTVAPNTWTQVAASYDGQNIRTYVNGTLASTTPWPYGLMSTSGNLLSVGRRQGGTEYFAGKIDELRVNRGPNAGTFVARYNKIPQVADDSRGITKGDFDKDGDLDLLVVNDTNHQNRLYFNNGLGTFTDVSATQLGVSAGYCYDVGAGDMDKDGDLDLFVLRKGQRTLLYANDGYGKFTDVTLTARMQADMDDLDGSARLWLLDLDTDGDLDLIVKKLPSTASPQPLRIYRNDGVGFFAADVADTLLPPSMGEAPLYDVAFGDLNKDGYLDMYWMQDNFTNRILLNDTTGKFAFKSLTNLPEENANEADAVAVDVDKDGDQDLVVCADPGVTRLWLNDGAGNFVDYTASRMPNLSLNCRDVDVADVNNDGAPDLWVTTYGNPVPATSPSGAGGASMYLFINDGRGNFKDETFPRLPTDTGNRALAALTMEPVDYDGDGDLDLIIGNHPCASGSNKNNLRLWENLSTNTGYFVDVTGGQNLNLAGSSCYCYYSCTNYGRVEDIAVGTIDLDGTPDLFLTRNNNGNLILTNSAAGKFTDVTGAKMAAPSSGSKTAMFDADGDGDLDLYVASNPDKLYLNTGDGLYSDVSPSNLPAQAGGASVGVVVADADRDGDLDVILAKAGRNQPRILMNIGYGKYQDYSSTTNLLQAPNGKMPVTNDITNNVIKGFFNKDAFEDLLFLNQGQSRIFHNQP